MYTVSLMQSEMLFGMKDWMGVAINIAETFNMTLFVDAALQLRRTHTHIE